MRKGLDEKIYEGVLRWFYVGECASDRSAGRLRKRWIDTVKECLRKRSLDVRQARKIVQDRSEWRGFVKGNIGQI